MDSIYVAVRKRILWIGGEAYPVGNIARVSTTVIRPDVGQAVLRFLARNAVCLLIVAVAGQFDRNINELIGPVTLTVLGLTFLALVVTVARRPRPALLVETNGPAASTLLTRSPEQLAGLVERIAEAINNPAAEFEVHMADVQIGDRITQVGGDNTVSKI